MVDRERFITSNETPFENDNQIYLPVCYGAGRLFYMFPKNQTQKIELVALEKEGRVYILEHMPRNLFQKESDAGFFDFHEEILRIEKEVNDYIIKTTKIPDDVLAEAKHESEGFLYRLKNNRSESKPHMYLTLKAIKDLNLPVRIFASAAVEIFLERESCRGYAGSYRGANKFSKDFYLNVALCRLYSEVIDELCLTEKEKAIADALYDKKDVTVKFDINGKRATGCYTVEQMMVSYTEGFPAPAPKDLTWENIVEMYSGKKETRIFKDDFANEKIYDERER